MPEYEYLVERFDISLLGKQKGQEQLNKLGEEEWELVAVVPVAEPSAFSTVPVTKAVFAYFKRQLEKD